MCAYRGNYLAKLNQKLNPEKVPEIGQNKLKKTSHATVHKERG
jgi:hypothetical protein